MDTPTTSTDQAGSGLGEQMPPTFVTAYEEPGRERFRLRLVDFDSSTV